MSSDIIRGQAIGEPFRHRALWNFVFQGFLVMCVAAILPERLPLAHNLSNIAGLQSVDFLDRQGGPSVAKVSVPRQRERSDGVPLADVNAVDGAGCASKSFHSQVADISELELVCHAEDADPVVRLLKRLDIVPRRE